MIVFYAISFCVLGALLGSFYACIGYRIPNKISIIAPGSRCDFCNKPLKWYMNIPIVSYLCLRGKCAYCKRPIDISNIMVELFTASVFTCSYLYFGFSKELIIMLLITSALSITAVSDFKYYYVSDRVVFTTLILMLITYIFLYDFNAYKYNLLGMALLFVAMLLIKLVGDKVFNRESLGGGDVKLMLIVGLALGSFNGLFALFIASVFALIAYFMLHEKYNDNMIPFGPFILLSTLVVYLLVSMGYLF